MQRLPHERLAELAPALGRVALAERALREPSWRLEELTGRLVELSGARANASLSLAFRLVRDAQEHGEHVAWITARPSCFFPPDVDELGVDLDALAVVRVPQADGVPVAADGLARSGAFGLLVLDLTARASAVPMALQSRLASLAQKHDLAVLCLTEKSSAVASLSSLVSLRAEARLHRRGPDAFDCELAVVKDKRRSNPWRHVEVCRGTPGLR